MKQQTQNVEQQRNVLTCENCGQRYKSKYDHFDERFCSTYCHEDWNFRVDVEDEYE